MKTNLSLENQKEALDNFASALELKIQIIISEDKRKNQTFCVTKDGTSLTGRLNYDQCTHFLLGWLKAVKYQKKLC